jgi:hypothetical protein
VQTTLASKPLALNPLRLRGAFALALAALPLVTLPACSDSSGPKVGALASLVVQPATALTALAGTAISTPIVIVPTDAQGQTIPGEVATFSVTAGGGTIANTTGTRNADGTITAPAWTLGKSAVPQTLQVSVEGKTATINATVTTAYSIEVRFFGRTLSTAEKALFTDAAARLLGAVVGAVPLVNAAGADPANCGVTGQAALTGTIHGVLIYASIDSIDGPRQILARAGPCYIRTDDTGQSDFRTVIGLMQFDSADVGTLRTSGNLQEVITHEMLHVLGFGTFWDSTSNNLLVNAGTPGVAYTGASGIAGCKSIGGTTTCGSTVPVEGSEGGDGTLNGHWRESTFTNELMTGFLNNGTNPLSAMTIRSLEDLGYVVDAAAADAYHIPGGSLRASLDIMAPSTTSSVAPTWERPLGIRVRALPILGLPTNIMRN